MKFNRKFFERTLFTIFLFATLGGIYIVGNAWFHPQSLSWRLTHYSPWPREDNFGVFCWIVSFISFFTWNLVRD
ncbi:hypothetical protein GOV14_00280 [Candidatus Pacearchaeota archaeon]|nr:hypothetical protein [Candidatus Pacearchaeota archaeon]